MNQEFLYQRLPILLQHLACSIEGQRIVRRRYNREFFQQLVAAEERATWEQERLLEYREKRLLTFVKHALQTVPFYRQRLQQLRIDANEIDSHYSFVNILPILTKAEVQKQHTTLLSQQVKPIDQVINHTSGTTGGGLRFATTWSAIREQWAIWWRYRRWHGIDLNLWCGYFGGRSIVPIAQQRPPFWRNNYPGRQVLFSGYHLGPATIDAYICELRKRRLPWLHGYPSQLTLIANYLIENKTELGYNLQHLTIGAENLMPHQRQAMKDAFGIWPRQHYGMAEAIANASECEQGNLHIDEDFAFVEVLCEPDKDDGQIIGTNFSNQAVPLLRYQVGDIGRLSQESCPCGRPGRILAAVDGRSEDYVILSSGTRIGRLDHIFKDLIHIREAQIHQSEIGAVTLRIVRSSQYSKEDEAQLKAEAQQRLGSDTAIRFEYWDELPRTKSGKLRFVLSELASGQIVQQ